ncbi:unnamed protein product [Rotaria magnacalcarata]|uniref:Uncharacterized protein n=1 Tax=Rotaria magnacalcarata TaxID=392030 RepID=A0A816LG49_9BILA|nr:unnamed protein product [Rotaria magnacalcarata]CAF4180639.1 unnamed protein product [Rotaria magnacalcarata]
MGTTCCCYTKRQRVSSSNSSPPQFIQIGIKTNDSPIPMDGYFGEPLLSLEETLSPFEGKINQLSYHIKEAKMNCHYPSEHNLTSDESSAIYIYTMKWSNRCLHDHIQTALNSNDRSTLQPWFKYLKLLKIALDKLPVANTEVWQGAPLDEKLREQLDSKSSSLYTSLCLCSLLMNNVIAYLKKTTTKKIMLVGYQSVNGRIVTGYTANDFQEVMVWPGIKLETLKSVVANTYYLWTFHGVSEFGEY